MILARIHLLHNVQFQHIKLFTARFLLTATKPVGYILSNRFSNNQILRLVKYMQQGLQTRALPILFNKYPHLHLSPLPSLYHMKGKSFFYIGNDVSRLKKATEQQSTPKLYKEGQRKQQKKKKKQEATKAGLQKVHTSLNKYPTTQQNLLDTLNHHLSTTLPTREDY